MALFVGLSSLLASYTLWAAIAGTYLAWVVAAVIYRRYFHPLAKVPGPFLASVTTLYQSYYNRRYYMKIAELHKKYGPVIRVTPNEVHLSDVENVEKIYNMGSRYYKSPDYYNAFCIPNSLFCTISNEAHKAKRAAVNPMFSRKMVLDLEEVVQDKVDKLIALVENALAENKPADLHHAFRSVSVDVITDYGFNKSYNLLDLPDLGARFFALVRGFGPVFWAFQQFTSMPAVAMRIPPWLAHKLSPPLGQVINLKMECLRSIEDVKERMEQGKLEANARPTIFSELLNPEAADGYTVPTSMGLTDDCYSMMAAAADTTGNTMTQIAFNVMSDRKMYDRLRAELLEAFPDPNARLDFLTFERLPYLTAVIKEGLRLGFGVAGRLPRVVPEPGATFNGYFIPPGYVVGTSSWTLHHNEQAFPESFEFKPERWLDPAESKRMERYMIPFGRGNRICVGMPLAYCELYVSMGRLFHRFGNLKVHLTTKDDLVLDDFFSTYNVAGKNWLKAVGSAEADAKA